MRVGGWSLGLLASILCVGCGDDPVAVSIPSVVFEDVTVVPMDRERLLPGHSVVVRDGRIAWMGPSEQAEPVEDALVVDGSGRYLMPGLADMHVHTWYERHQLLYVAYGVTTVRNLWGSDTQLDFRRRIEAGDLLGPTIVTSGPILDGDPPVWPGSRVVTTPAEARAAVREQSDAGFDFVKTYNRLQPEAYQALLDEAGAVGFPVAGHVPQAVGLDAVIAGPQVSIEHLNRYATLLQSDPPHPDDRSLGESGWLTADPDLMPVLARRMAADGVASVPTLALWDRISMEDSEEAAFLSRPEIDWLAADMVERWLSQRLPANAREIVREGQPARLAMVRALRDSGALILAGTDVGNPFLIPGVSLHEELALLVDSGLTPFEALAAATRNAADFLGQSGVFGVVAEGARADLILVTGNPLEDVAHANRRVGVMVRGRWFDEAVLRGRLGG